MCARVWNVWRWRSMSLAKPNEYRVHCSRPDWPYFISQEAHGPRRKAAA
jgi:hypothetical protein